MRPRATSEGRPLIPSPLVARGQGRGFHQPTVPLGQAGGQRELSKWERYYPSSSRVAGFVAQDSDTGHTTQQIPCDASTLDATNETRIPYVTAAIRLVTFRPGSTRCDELRSPATYPALLRHNERSTVSHPCLEDLIR